MPQKRELLEETGFRAEKLKRLIEVYSSPGFTDEIAHIFTATELKRGKQILDETERIKVVPMSIKRVENGRKRVNKRRKDVGGIATVPSA